MSTIGGLPAHILLNHLVVVLGPLVAMLAIMCALWPAARQRLIWLTLALAVITLVVTPLTASSGEWLEGRLGKSPEVETHRELGESLAYYVAAQAVAVTLLTIVHIRHVRERTIKSGVRALVTLLVISAAAATLVQTYRVGDSGAQAAWGSVASAPAELRLSAELFGYRTPVE
ncbi:hypothetical protein MB901379_00239 [Mycobacterium basiliense]|uniref:Uncharacterized protein n=1 Tax=Mycobacterium basiliense TaxID=2094119 RepID=A0A3S4CS87_9MYCO|nr:DUF2231 domain-containing protein [Mycobacterium basiliense]VDM86714.1 hypothetical protein MB901379_00239 [Mycobacterium basiliense]